MLWPLKSVAKKDVPGEKVVVVPEKAPKAVVEAAGSSMDKVIKVTIFVKDLNDFNTVNEVYGTYFTKDFPARSCVQVARLPKDALIEIEAIAVK